MSTPFQFGAGAGAGASKEVPKFGFAPKGTPQAVIDEMVKEWQKEKEELQATIDQLRTLNTQLISGKYETRTAVRSTADASTQAGGAPSLAIQMSAQLEIPVRSIPAQLENAPPATIHMSTQTDDVSPPSTSDASTQADTPESPIIICDSGTQTSAKMKSTGMQTSPFPPLRFWLALYAFMAYFVLVMMIGGTGFLAAREEKKMWLAANEGSRRMTWAMVRGVGLQVGRKVGMRMLG